MIIGDRMIYDNMAESFVEFGDDSVEFVEVNILVCGSFLVDMGAVQHLQKVIIIDSILQPLGNSLELLKVKNSVFILVIKSEHFLDSILGLGLAHSRADDIKELIKGNCSVLIL